MKNSCPGSARRPAKKRELRAEIEELEHELNQARTRAGIAIFHIPAERAEAFLADCKNAGVGIGADACS